MVEAFKEMDTVVFIPSIIHPSFKRIPEVENLVYAAKRSGGVVHIIFIGYYADQHNNPFHMSPYFGYAARLLATSGIDYSYRSQMCINHFNPLPELMNMHKLIYPAGDRSINYITRNDIAGVIAIIKNPDTWGKRYLLSGYSYDMKELAAILSEASGTEIKYEPVFH